MPTTPSSGGEASTASSAGSITAPPTGSIAARLDRLPVTGFHWRLVLVSQLFWGAVLAMDPLVLRIYPVVWEPAGTISTLQYTLLVGFSNGFGPLLGVLLFGPLSDRWGRKKVMVTSCVLAAVTVPVLGLTSNWVILMISVTGTGIGVGGALVVSPAYNTEIAPPFARSRLLLGAQVLGFALVLFSGTLVALALLPEHPLWFALVFTFIALALIPTVLFCIPESPRWLESHGRAAEADEIVRKVEGKVIARGLHLDEPDYASHRVQETGRVPIGTLFRGEYLNRTILLLIVWILIYVGINYGFQGFQSVYLVEKGFSANELFTMLTYGGLGGIAALLLGAILSERVERKTYVLMSAFAMILAALGYFFLYDSFFWTMLATVFATGALGGILGSMYNYTAIAFPTRVRATGVALTDGVGHLGATFGATIAGVFYAATASYNYIGWFVWFAIIGGLLPAALIYFFGQRQRSAALEELSR